jgi:hypothetical protein
MKKFAMAGYPSAPFVALASAAGGADGAAPLSSLIVTICGLTFTPARTF